MPIRNPFKRGPGGLESTDGIPPETTENGSNGFQNTSVVGAKPIDIKEPLEYKLSGKISLPADTLRFCCRRAYQGRQC
jgi:hypothetical protein